MVETRLLRQFIAVAEELNFHKAANRLYMAQPALSQAIHRLEQKLGFHLFIRNRREVRLTPAGSTFLDVAYRTLKELEQGIEQARQVCAGTAGQLTICTLSLACYDGLLNSLRRFRETFPKVQLVIREMPSSSQAKALLAGEADIAFMRLLPMPAESIESRLILNEQIVMALPAGHPQANNLQVRLQDFADEPFVFTPQPLGSGYHRQLTALCEAAGFEPRVIQEAAQIHTLIALVACGFGVALVPESIAGATLRDKVMFRPIDAVGSRPNPSIGLYMSRNRHNASPLLDSFIALLEFAAPASAEMA
ncbi:LysR family transcriptional regulator [Pseudomonas sp. L5B5]|uniref:LysR family transcriptional regulator n=1 Tax=Pseudomonas sp. L5B5 TaxID=2883205 RepID=UPI001CFBC050|nr:LysR family transcriptional regulator [Pseudomonas sp. L5B5]UCZ86815.1 LysR family transcriptional regulator [Pseudomonas sp. L5B5]